MFVRCTVLGITLICLIGATCGTEPVPVPDPQPVPPAPPKASDFDGQYHGVSQTGTSTICFTASNGALFSLDAGCDGIVNAFLATPPEGVVSVNRIIWSATVATDDAVEAQIVIDLAKQEDGTYLGILKINRSDGPQLQEAFIANRN